MRAALIVVVSLCGPALLFFLWAWASAMKRERKVRGTLPAWQDMPWTNLLIVGLLLAIAGTLALYFVDDRPGGLLGQAAAVFFPTACGRGWGPWGGNGQGRDRGRRTVPGALARRAPRAAGSPGRER